MLASIHDKDPDPHRRSSRTPLPLGLPVLPLASGDLSTCLSAPLSTWLILQSSKVTHCTPHPTRVIPSSALSSELWLPILRPHLVLDSSKLNPDSHCPSTLLPPLLSPYSSCLSFLPGFPSFILFSPGSWSLKLGISIGFLVLCFSPWSPRFSPMSVSPLLETWAGVSKPSLHSRWDSESSILFIWALLVSLVSCHQPHLYHHA